ncbi:MAG TPA: 4'-phosphopantetheinyl transferase superfamily protein [Baekduia sp.]|uniref:4'-phosphopantetheinyl transferase family protein n=1 Tax=Baekduia sp. TaxID=2600305 RepID=UPI002D784032|nr:4'-phosphopantetheinyl transferase superfamily protein [Baekduia sp.]HET6505591.1 4'-phosphopantetheinyl transferase superfamily protein [Baekduia sp.]
MTRALAEPAVRLLVARPAEPYAELVARARVASAGTDAPRTSRSYCFPYAVLAWHTGRVGVDLERVAPCDMAFARLVCTPRERAHLAGRPVGAHDALLTSLWSGKEAMAKAAGDARRYEPSRLDAPLLWPGHRAGRWRARSLTGLPPGHVGWLVWAEAGPDASE